MAYSSPNASIIKNTGGFGSTFVTTSALYTGEYYAIQAVEDCTFLTLSASNVDNVSDWVTKSVVLPAGLLIAGNFTAIQLNGRAMLYKH